MLRRFNIRVYGILMNDKEQILLSDESIKGNLVTKFPGGGLELGEGLVAALVREFNEECKTAIQVTEHFYTTEMFVPSTFDDESQLISVYYLCQCPTWESIQTSFKKFDFVMKEGIDAESFRWVNILDLEKEENINLEIDKIVVEKLLQTFPKVGFRIPSK